MNKIVYCYNLILEKKPIVLALSFFYDFIQIIIIANQRFPCAVWRIFVWKENPKNITQVEIY